MLPLEKAGFGGEYTKVERCFYTTKNTCTVNDVFTGFLN